MWLALTGCAGRPPPTAELATARQAVARGGDADADQYAADEVSQARRALELAQAAMAQGREDDARSLAVQAAAVADLAHAYSRKAVADIGYCHLEKLHNLEALPSTGFMIACFPVKIRGASAGWTRAVAIKIGRA